VIKYPEVYKEIIEAGHTVGNHTQHHLSASKTSVEDYVSDVVEASKHIISNLFRPPYGRISNRQAKALQNLSKPYKIVMYNVLSADFDANISTKRCINNVLNNISNGAIIVFHDSDKAANNLHAALPVVLTEINRRGFEMKAL
jgi:peptidoglycan-N-acetylglucosamine deacetylase